MICIDCKKFTRKLKPAVIRENWTKIGYVCFTCWAEWAPFMHAKETCVCDHCKWCKEQLRQRWAYGSGPDTLEGGS